MSRSLSEEYKANLNTTASCDPDIELIEITHPDLPTVVRLANFNEDIVSNGNTYLATAFDAEWPSDKSSGESPKAKLIFDNIGRSLTQWIENTCGGRCAEVTLIITTKSNPDYRALELCLDVNSVCMTCERIEVNLSYDNIFNKKAVQTRHDECHSPGLF